jgi:putative transposon-encoded protein
LGKRKNKITGDNIYLEAKVVEFGTNGAHITVPRAWLGMRVKVIPLPPSSSPASKKVTV